MNIAVILNRLILDLVKSLVQPDPSALRPSNWKELKCRESDLGKKNATWQFNFATGIKF